MEQKVTLITTVKNEEKSIGLFLESIKKQTRKPDEIIIADGGSTDNTIKIISGNEYKSLRVKLIRKKGNRSVGRNTAIKNSRNKIILVSDAGCILDTNWVKKISSPFTDTKVGVVAGFYKPAAHTVFQKCLATYTCTMPDSLDKKSFLPSSRSVAFRMSAWKKAGGYPEHLDTCEDLVFDKKLKRCGAEFVTQDKAIVYWPQRKNILQAARQFYGYAVGDGRAHYFRTATPLLFGRYVVGLGFLGYILISKNYNLLPVILLFLIVYLLWAVWKNYRYVKRKQAFFYLPLLQLVSDICVILGTSIGFLQTI